VSCQTRLVFMLASAWMLVCAAVWGSMDPDQRTASLRIAVVILAVGLVFLMFDQDDGEGSSDA
jgi:hypothetical protein